MEQFEHISIAQVHEWIEAGKQPQLVDIRDEQSFEQGHIEHAYHLTNGTLHQFTQQADMDAPVVVICYHGVSSQGAAQYLLTQGFDQVYSMDGGMEAWRREFPVVAGQS